MRIMVALSLLILACTQLSSASADTPSVEIDELPYFEVEMVEDGDTITLMIDDREVGVELMGLEAPLSSIQMLVLQGGLYGVSGVKFSLGEDAEEQPYGPEACEFLCDQVCHGIQLDPLTDEGLVPNRYGRLEAYVWAGDVLVNELMISEGYARFKDDDRIPEDRRALFLKAEEDARKAKIGMWSVLVDINHGTLDDFLNLPSMTEELARRIIDYRIDVRPFESVDDLAKVEGVSGRLLDKLRPYLYCIQ